MAKQNRTTLKNYFQTGDKPSQAQYADLIDSKVNLSESNTGDIELRGNINILEGNITASGNISASGNILADSGSFNYIESINKIRHTNDVNTEVSFASDTVVIKANNRENFRGGGNDTRVGNNDTPTRISGSSVRFNTPINTTSNIITTLNVTATGNITSNATGSFSNIQASGNISSSGTGSFNGGIILVSPNGSQFRFTVDNSGHLSLTGSAV